MSPTSHPCPGVSTDFGLAQACCLECGYTYAWKMADTINASTFALLVPEFGMFDDVHVPELSLLRVLRAVRSRILARPKKDDRPRVPALPEC